MHGTKIEMILNREPSIGDFISKMFTYLLHCLSIAGKNPFEDKVMSPEQGIYVKRRLGKFGRERYRKLSQFYKEQLNVIHPSHDRVRQKEKDLMPELSVVECGGICANISELVKKNVEETLAFFVKPEDLLDVHPNDIKAYYSIGGDASGNNPVYQSKNQHGSPNIIFYGMRLGKLVTSEKELYIEQSLGKNTEIPIGAIPAKESNAEVFEACLRRLEQQIQAAEQSTHHITVKGKVTILYHVIFAALLQFVI